MTDHLERLRSEVYRATQDARSEAIKQLAEQSVKIDTVMDRLEAVWTQFQEAATASNGALEAVRSKKPNDGLILTLTWTVSEPFQKLILETANYGDDIGWTIGPDDNKQWGIIPGAALADGTVLSLILTLLDHKAWRSRVWVVIDVPGSTDV